MQDPSQGVDPRLLAHLHLLIIPQAPKQHRLNNNAAVEWLQKVPQLVKERPVSWQFISPPETGTMFFEWLHPGRTDKFPSDGYAWLDMEHAYEREISDQYVLDILVAYCGIVPESAPVAFMRTRYRVRSKHNIPGPFDPSFWLVHYAMAEPQYQGMVQRGGIQLRPDVIHLLNERRVLQSQGLPQRKDFMLVDRNSWPQVHYPSMARGGPPYSNRPGPGPGPGPGPSPVPGPAQSPYGYAGANAHAAGPPAKRARQAAPVQAAAGAMSAPPVSLYHDSELELLEDTSSGDYLDNISPAQISRERFKRHHLWLEEVFSSLYSPSQILPEDLGFGLVGELGELTKGLLNPPTKKNLSEQERKDPMSFYQDPQINASSAYKQLDSEQFADFENRVAAFVDAKNKEMDLMKEQHAEIMSRISKGKYYVDAEERLREAGSDAQKVEAIVEEVENKMGISLIERQDIVCVDRGNLEDEKPPSVNGMSTDQNGTINGHTDTEDAPVGLASELPVDDVIPDVEEAQITEPPAQVAAETADAAVDAGIDTQDGMDLDAPASADTVVPSASELSLPGQKQSEQPEPAVAIPEPAPSTDQGTTEVPVPVTAQPSAELSATVESPTGAVAPPLESTTAQATLVTPIVAAEPTPNEGDDVMGEPESMFDSADFNNFDGIEGEFEAAAAAGGNGGNEDDGLLDFGGDFGDSAGTGTTPTATT